MPATAGRDAFHLQAQTPMTTHEFDIMIGNRRVTCLLAEPESLAADPALLMTFTFSRQRSMFDEIYNIPARTFLDEGHRVLSFDMPSHGERVAPWKSEGISGFCESITAGVDPFAIFVEDGKAAIDAALAQGLTRPGRLCLAGLSRAGYSALRLAAADDRITATAAIAPVTDWRALSEFAGIKDRVDMAAMSIENFAPQLAGKAICLTIGSSDGRVGTDRCAGFVARLFEIEAQRGINPSRLRVHFLHDSLGHALANVWRREAVEYLLNAMPR